MAFSRDFAYSVDSIDTKATLEIQKAKTIQNLLCEVFIELNPMDVIENSIICWIESWQKARAECEDVDLADDITEFIEDILYECLVGASRHMIVTLKDAIGRSNKG